VITFEGTQQRDKEMYRKRQHSNTTPCTKCILQ